MKENFTEKDLLKGMWKGIFWFMVISIVMTVFFTALNAGILPWQKKIERNVVEQSKSFVDGNNNMLATYQLEYSRLELKIIEAQGDPVLISGYNTHQKAIIEKMCRQISTMSEGTVNPDTTRFLSMHGGCN